MKKAFLILLVVFMSTVSFSQVRAKIVLGHHPVHHRYHRQYHRVYVAPRPVYHHPYRRHHRRNGVVLKANL